MKNFTKILVTTLILSVMSTGAFSQNTDHFLATYNEWYVLEWFEGGWTTMWYTEGDTSLLQSNYKIVRTKNLYDDTDFGVHGFIREDTIEDIIYYLNYDQWSATTDSIEYRLYDFSKQPGDTVEVDDRYAYPEQDTVFLILDSIVTDADTMGNTFYYLHNIVDTWNIGLVIWIKGVGSKAGLISNINEWDGYSGSTSAMLCAFSEGIEVFHVDFLFGSDPNWDDYCIMYWSGVKEFEVDMSKIFPNPTHDYIYFELPVGVDNNITIDIISLDGRLLATEKSNSAKQKIDLSSFNNGIYFLRIQYGNVTKFSKVVKI